MSGTQSRPVVVSQEAKLQRIKMGVLEGLSSQPVTIAPLTEVNGTLTGLSSPASTVPTIWHHLRSLNTPVTKRHHEEVTTSLPRNIIYHNLLLQSKNAPPAKCQLLKHQKGHFGMITIRFYFLSLLYWHFFGW